MNTKNWIDFIIKETESALTLLYSYMGFYDALKNEEVVKAANKNSEFWRTHTASLQHTLFLYLGRLSDDGSDCKSFSDFNTHCILNVSDFSKESFLSRRGEVLKMNPGYLNDSEFPTKQELCDLFSMATKYNGYLRAECKTIRSKVYAHAIYTEEQEYYHLFKKIELTQIEEVLLALWSVSQYLWQSYENAKTISAEVLTFSQKEKIYESTLKAITGAI
jgi:hypothetical protein